MSRRREEVPAFPRGERAEDAPGGHHAFARRSPAAAPRPREGRPDGVGVGTVPRREREPGHDLPRMSAAFAFPWAAGSSRRGHGRRGWGRRPARTGSGTGCCCRSGAGGRTGVGGPADPAVAGTALERACLPAGKADPPFPQLEHATQAAAREALESKAVMPVHEFVPPPALLGKRRADGHVGNPEPRRPRSGKGVIRCPCPFMTGSWQERQKNPIRFKRLI